MKKNYTLLFIMLLCAVFAQAQTTPAFPGAEGFARYTVTGGRGGIVYHVTNLNDSGEGSLRAGIDMKVPRTIVFDVSGIIELKSRLVIKNGDLTIAGQTAPGDGICIKNYTLHIAGYKEEDKKDQCATNIIIRFIRCRMGDEQKAEDDAMWGRYTSDIIIDHCSMSWSTDECASFYSNKNFTMQWCILSESLTKSVHVKGNHGYGAIWGGEGASFHHNLLAHHSSRTPRLDGSRSIGRWEEELTDLRNNVFYNWGPTNGGYAGEGGRYNFVNNYYKPGPATPKNSPVRYRIAAIGVRIKKYCMNADGTPNAWKPMEHVWGKFYVDGNIIEGNEEVTQDNWTKGIYGQINNASCDNTFTKKVKKEMRLSEPLDAGIITTHSAKQAYELVLDQAGCSRQRDAIDIRVIEETRNGTATYIGSVTKGAESVPGLIDLPADVKPEGATSPWPTLSDGGITADELRDTDGDGIPDVWEAAHGLNPKDVSDGIATTLSKEGYTNLEVYLNGLVK